MVRKIVSGIMSILLALSMLSLLSNIQPVRAQGTIYINVDGSLTPPTAPIFTIDNITYSLTDNIIDGEIIVNRGGIVLDGGDHTLLVSAWMFGISIFSDNVTIEKMTVAGALGGIEVQGNYDIIYGNTVTNNFDGIYVLGNNNTVFGNNITANKDVGVAIGIVPVQSWDSNYNCVCGNNIINNGEGILISPFSAFSDNVIYHNNFIGNFLQVDSYGTMNVWDNGYPSGGNYWSDYSGRDVYSGPSQKIPGSDGIGDTPYIIDANNKDHYPLMQPWTGHDVAVTSVASSKTLIGTGFMVIGTPFSDNVTVQVADYGNYAESFNVTAYANSTVIGTEQVSLNATDQTTLTFGWNTTGLAYGNYIISVYSWPVPGETNTANNNFTGSMVTVTIPGDINGDFKVNLVDVVTLALVYRSHCANYNYQGEPASPNWNPNADIDGNGVVGLIDLVILANHYHRHYP